jgi:hypothetical protein|tara:strand:- start:1882 stop:2391 length:510 start_codon:yes stop_codon:yes gene_type:complete
MALTAITVGAADHFGKGGVKSIEVSSYAEGGQSITYTAGTNVAAGSIGTNKKVIDFEKESANMTISSSSELVGLSVNTITIEGYVPKITNDKLESLQSLLDAPLVGKVTTWDGVVYLVGWEESTATSASSTEFPMVMSGLEVATGSSLSDQNGCTLTFTCKQVHLPATF